MHRHALPRKLVGTASSTDCGITAAVHQHGVAPAAVLDERGPQAIVQRLGCPHRGQRVGSTSVISGSLREPRAAVHPPSVGGVAARVIRHVFICFSLAMAPSTFLLAVVRVPVW